MQQMSADRFRCPECGFRIFNRRVAKCESCGAALPAELLLTAEQTAQLDAAHERSRQERAERKEKEKRDISGSDAGADFL